MEIKKHEYYISLEVAKLLKKAGFKWFINSAYRDGVLMRQGNLLCDNFNGKRYEDTARHEFFSAPTLDVAQRWLREIKHAEVLIEIKNLPHTVYYARVEHEKYGYVLGTQSTYEETQEAGIKKALEIILEKGE
jgi:hypothetical protein